MKVFIVFAVLGEYEPEILDRVYTDRTAAEKRVEAIDEGVSSYHSWWAANQTRKFDRSPDAVALTWASETGYEWLGDIARLIPHLSLPAHYEERDVLG